MRYHWLSCFLSTPLFSLIKLMFRYRTECWINPRTTWGGTNVSPCHMKTISDRIAFCLQLSSILKKNPHDLWVKFQDGRPELLRGEDCFFSPYNFFLGHLGWTFLKQALWYAILHLATIT